MTDFEITKTRERETVSAGPLRATWFGNWVQTGILLMMMFSALCGLVTYFAYEYAQVEVLKTTTERLDRTTERIESKIDKAIDERTAQK